MRRLKTAGLNFPQVESDLFFKIIFSLPDEFSGSGAGTGAGAGNADGSGFGGGDEPGEVVGKGGRKRWSEKVVGKGGQKKWSEKVLEKVPEKRLTGNQKSIIEQLLKDPYKTNKELALHIGIGL